jgi:hypothetical protein
LVKLTRCRGGIDGDAGDVRLRSPSCCCSPKSSGARPERNISPTIAVADRVRAAAAEFVLWPKFGTSTYFLMTALALVDFLSGLALRTRRRAVAAAPAPAPQPKAAEPPPKAAEKVEIPAAEPQIAPTPAAAPAAPSVPPAASVAESVLKDHPEPKPVQPAVAPRRPPKTPTSPFTRSPFTGSPVTDCSRAQVFRHRRISRTRLSADASVFPAKMPDLIRGSGSRKETSNKRLDGLPRPEAGGQRRIRLALIAVCASAGSSLRQLLVCGAGGRDQLRDEG